MTGFVAFVLFGRRLSENFCVAEYLHCVRRLLALQALFLLRRLLPLVETSSGVLLPGTSSSSLPLGGQGRQEGSQGAPGVLSRGASSPPARSRSSGRGGGASGLLSGARSLFSFSFGSGRGGGCPLAVGFLFSPLLTSLSLPNSHRTFHDVRIRGRLRSLASAYYPPVVLVLRIVKHGRIRGPGHVGVARGCRCGCRSRSSSRSRSKVEGVDSSCRPLGSLLVPARAVCGRGLLTATARGVGAFGFAVTGLDPWIDTRHTVTGGGLLTAPGRVISACV